MSGLYPRWQSKVLKKALKTRRVLLLSGARQTGKTTLAKQLAGREALYRTLDQVDIRQFALNDPHGFVEHGQSMLIIDEIQRAPDLLSAIKMVVDEDTRPGQYLLTGSANIQSLPSVQESLAGRVSKVRLRPLSQGELVGAEPLFLEKAFKQNFILPSHETYHRKNMLEIAFRGGFPEAIALASSDRGRWHRDYIEALLERDLNEIAQINQHGAMQELVRILAAWSGKLMDISTIGSGLSIHRSTLESYINALQTLYLVERIYPWTRTDYERVGKQSKLYMTDSGLMAAVLRWRMEQVMLDSDRVGKIIETFLFNELAAQIDANDGQYELFHYRDREKREIDFLIERDDHSLLGIEIKASSTINTADFKHLTWFKETLAKDKTFVGIVLYSGENVISMGKNLWAVPFGALWAHD